MVERKSSKSNVSKIRLVSVSPKQVYKLFCATKSHARVVKSNTCKKAATQIEEESTQTEDIKENM